MPKSIIEFFKKHIKDNFFLYSIILFCFLIGVSVGAFTVKVVNIHQKQELVAYLRGFFRLLDESGLTGLDIFKESFSNNFQLLLLNWFMGLILVGIPFVFMIIIFKGFVIGFTVGLIIEEFKLYGILLFVFAIFPQNIILVPAYIIAAVTSISFAFIIIKAKINKVKNFNYSRHFLIYTTIYLAVFATILIASFIESFIVPFFIKVIVRYIQ
ncbi:stage II sporulation protein M [Alkaliphilus peptidifermentans]|uniref:Stage II sporulation protein M n=1 Tax=Alkaliphilus peptidifermentans DSM 18978 TaxID=1120976 RepID=A0A1G5KED9_9FIRM|nr:stage II sporulation protein M [Alkaliphilus peptidifermentans]SCY98962.1 stage II sporulation protein M [Alkaliphilus peptidifermentans DSM 18978]